MVFKDIKYATKDYVIHKVTFLSLNVAKTVAHFKKIFGSELKEIDVPDAELKKSTTSAFSKSSKGLLKTRGAEGVASSMPGTSPGSAPTDVARRCLCVGSRVPSRSLMCTSASPIIPSGM